MVLNDEARLIHLILAERKILGINRVVSEH